jgi:hypothetical protein
MVNESRPIKKQVAWCAEPLSLTPRVDHLSPVQAPVGLIDMLRVRIGPAPPARDALDVEIGHLRVSAFDERLVLLRIGEHHARFNIVSKPPRVEAVLQ